MKTTQIKIEGMTCDACVASAQHALQSVPGVLSASVNLQKGIATVQADNSTTSAALLTAVEEAGYDAQPLAAT